MAENSGLLARRTLLQIGSGAALLVPAVPDALAASSAKSSGMVGIKGSEVTLKFASTMPTHTRNAHTVWFHAFVKRLHKQTNGRVGADFYGSSELGPESNYPRMIQFGSIDMMMGPSIWASIVPQVSVLTMGFLFDSWKQFGQVIDGAAGKRLAHIFKEKTKAEVLGWAYNFGARNVLSKPAITKPAQFHGLKLRVLPSPTFVKTFKLLGADPVAMSFGQIYTALQTGTIEGLEHDSPTILQNKFYEVAKNLTLTRHIFDPLTPIISKHSLHRLSAHDQGALRHAAQAAVQYQRGQATEAATHALNELKKKGVTSHNIDRRKLREEVKPLYASFTKKYPETKSVLNDIQKVTGHA